MPKQRRARTEDKMPDENKPETPAGGGSTTTLSLLDQVVQQGRMAKDPSQQPYARDLVREFVGQVLDQSMKVSADTVASINDRIAQIDQLISDQLNEIMHDPEFQKLEAAWRGLNYLVMNTETGTMLKLRLLNLTKQELLTDMEKAVEHDQSVMFKRIYEDEYGTFGGSPYSVLVGDFEFGRATEDVETLQKMSGVAAAAHAPFIAMASPKLFDWSSFSELSTPRDLSKGFESTELIKWNAFRESDDSRYVALTLPHVLMRVPYGTDGPDSTGRKPVDGFASFKEEVDGVDNSKYLWGNSAYVLGQRITNAFAHYHWCAAIRGVEGGGLVEGLPVYNFKTADGDIALKSPTET